jgi:hypothetical protein
MIDKCGTAVHGRDPAIPSDVRVARMSQRGRRRRSRWRYAGAPPGYRGARCAKLEWETIERGAAHPGYSLRRYILIYWGDVRPRREWP